jgi:broad specificity phosphatase PhoE
MGTQHESAEMQTSGDFVTLDEGGADRTILIVAHGAAISALVGTFLQDMGIASLADGIVRTRIWNCSITEVIVEMAELPIRNNRVDFQPLIEVQSRKAFIIERWAGE